MSTPQTEVSAPAPTVWPTVNCMDAQAQIRFLVEALGFVEVAVHTGADPGVIEHAELAWPEGGGIMLGSAGREHSEFSLLPTGAGSYYVVTDEPDVVLARATGAGAELTRPIREEDYGSRGFTVRDPEGNLWSFGTYRGEPPPQP